MIIQIPHETIELARKITELVVAQKQFSQISSLTAQFYDRIVNCVGKDYFNLKKIPIRSIAFDFNNMSSHFNFNTDKTTIGVPSYLNRYYLAAKLIADTVHEGVHCCQKEFNAENQQNSSGYTRALCYSLPHQRLVLPNETLRDPISMQTYIAEVDNEIKTKMYYGQPCEAQANALAYDIMQKLVDNGVLDLKDVRALQFMKEQATPLELIRDGNTQYNIIATMSKLTLNFYDKKDYAIEKKVINAYKTLAKDKLSQSEQASFENYIARFQSAPEKQMNILELVMNSDVPINSRIIDIETQKKVEDALLSDITLSTDGRLEQVTLFVAGHQYQAPFKDINEFLFVIGEKRFIDIAYRGPEKSENYAIEEIEKE